MKDLAFPKEIRVQRRIVEEHIITIPKDAQGYGPDLDEYCRLNGISGGHVSTNKEGCRYYWPSKILMQEDPVVVDLGDETDEGRKRVMTFDGIQTDTTK